MVLSRLGLLEVDDVVPGGTVAVPVEAELVAAEACGGIDRIGVKWVYGFTPARDDFADFAACPLALSEN